MTLYTEEIFGPVVSMSPVESLDEAIDRSTPPNGNAASIFTESGAAARKFRYEVETGNIGINVGVAAPVAYFPFSGGKDSFFGALHPQGKTPCVLHREESRHHPLDQGLKRFEYSASAAHEQPLDPKADWSPEALVLAGLVKCSLASLEFFGARQKIAISGSGAADGVVAKRDADGRYGFVEILCGLDVTLEPKPEGESSTHSLLRPSGAASNRRLAHGEAALRMARERRGGRTKILVSRRRSSSDVTWSRRHSFAATR